MVAESSVVTSADGTVHDFITFVFGVSGREIPNCCCTSYNELVEGIDEVGDSEETKAKVQETVFLLISPHNSSVGFLPLLSCSSFCLLKFPS